MYRIYSYTHKEKSKNESTIQSCSTCKMGTTKLCKVMLHRAGLHIGRGGGGTFLRS